MPKRPCPAGGILFEAAVVALLGAALAFGANEISPRGLKLGRNYFPGGNGNSVPPAKPSLSPPSPATVSDEPAAAEIEQRLKGKGLQSVDLAQTEKDFRDPRREQGLIIFVDARGEDHYRDGHIPGAYELDPYHPEKELVQVLPACQFAEQVVVYCTGGDCEDADSTAIVLRDAGIPNQKLFVFGGGYTEWNEHHLPAEQGDRDSAAASGQNK